MGLNIQAYMDAEVEASRETGYEVSGTFSQKSISNRLGTIKEQITTHLGGVDVDLKLSENIKRLYDDIYHKYFEEKMTAFKADKPPIDNQYTYNTYSSYISKLANEVHDALSNVLIQIPSEKSKKNDRIKCVKIIIYNALELSLVNTHHRNNAYLAQTFPATTFAQNNIGIDGNER